MCWAPRSAAGRWRTATSPSTFLATPLFATAVEPADLPGLPGFPTDVETLLGDIPDAQNRTGDPGGAAFFTNEQGARPRPTCSATPSVSARRSRAAAGRRDRSTSRTSSRPAPAARPTTPAWTSTWPMSGTLMTLANRPARGRAGSRRQPSRPAAVRQDAAPIARVGIGGRSTTNREVMRPVRGWD